MSSKLLEVHSSWAKRNFNYYYYYYFRPGTSWLQIIAYLNRDHRLSCASGRWSRGKQTTSSPECVRLCVRAATNGFGDAADAGDDADT